jgi:nicotinamidase-related amidase
MQDLRRDAPYEAGATALLFVDMQTIWAEPGLDPHHPDWPADHYFYEQLRSVTIPNQVRLLEAARSAGSRCSTRSSSASRSTVATAPPTTC